MTAKIWTLFAILVITPIPQLAFAHGDSPYLLIVKNAIELNQLLEQAAGKTSSQRLRLFDAIDQKYETNVHLLEEMMLIPREDYPREEDFQQSLMDRVKLLEKHQKIMKRIYQLFSKPSVEHSKGIN